VAPEIEARFKSRRAHLRHLALVFQVEVRLKITAECYLRAMSPKEFAEEFGGGSVARIAQHFEFLEARGWLVEVTEKEETPRRRGHVEKLYRATTTPFFDAETWSLLPYSLRLAYSWSSFKATAKELRQGIEGAGFDGGSGRKLTCTVLELDVLGWTRVIARLDADFEAVYAEQVNAKIRDALGQGELSRVGILQVGFELPSGHEGPAAGLADGLADPPIPFPERMAPIFADDLCLKILEEANKSDLTVKGFHREFASDVSVGVVRGRFARLKELGWIRVVKKIRRRAAHEHVFRAMKPAVVDNGPWADVPDSLGGTEVWATFMRFSALVKEAIVCGSFDLRDDRHLAWCIVELDRTGRQKTINNMEKLHAFIAKEEVQAKKRIAVGAKPVRMTIALGVQGSPVVIKAP
jgi:hypothetical protein